MSYRSEPFKGKIRIGQYSSFQKLMRAIRRGVVTARQPNPKFKHEWMDRPLAARW